MNYSCQNVELEWAPKVEGIDTLAQMWIDYGIVNNNILEQKT